MTDIKSMTLAELTDALKAAGEAGFSGKQVYAWLHGGSKEFEQMSNLS